MASAAAEDSQSLHKQRALLGSASPKSLAWKSGSIAKPTTLLILASLAAPPSKYLSYRPHPALCVATSAALLATNSGSTSSDTIHA